MIKQSIVRTYVHVELPIEEVGWPKLQILSVENLSRIRVGIPKKCERNLKNQKELIHVRTTAARVCTSVVVFGDLTVLCINLINGLTQI